MGTQSYQSTSRKAILLDGSQANDGMGERVRAALEARLRANGWDVEHVVVRDKKIGNCAGDFFCWIRTPGTCVLDDDNRAIAAAIVGSDLMVYLTPVTFGGYSSALKRMVDHQIQNISPFFAKVEGETHHQKRYAKYPDYLVAGWMDAPDAQAEAVFRHLVHRNAINFYAARSVSGVVLAGQSDGEILASVQTWLNELDGGGSSPAVTLPTSGDPSAVLERSDVRSALLLVGSPRASKSTSYSLGGYLFERLGTHGIQTETIHVHSALRSPEKTEALLEATDAADLVALAFPLYVDSLPAPTIAALERIASHRQGREGTPRQLFSAIVNCGFPEAHHNATALAICETFARQAGFAWAGALALGGGGMIDGKPLAEMDGRAIPIVKSLDLAAEALAQGRAIPAAAQDILAKPVVPTWAYSLLGGIGWRLGARRYGAQSSLRRRPYAPERR